MEEHEARAALTQTTYLSFTLTLTSSNPATPSITTLLISQQLESPTQVTTPAVRTVNGTLERLSVAWQAIDNVCPVTLSLQQSGVSSLAVAPSSVLGSQGSYLWTLPSSVFSDAQLGEG